MLYYLLFIVGCANRGLTRSYVVVIYGTPDIDGIAKHFTVSGFIQTHHCFIIVDDNPRQFGNKQHPDILNSYITSLSISSHLTCMDMFPPTHKEMNT
jgi:hypothetical protein